MPQSEAETGEATHTHLCTYINVCTHLYCMYYLAEAGERVYIGLATSCLMSNWGEGEVPKEGWMMLLSTSGEKKRFEVAPNGLRFIYFFFSGIGL